ncbi:penicillin-binding protein activator, partial [Methylobacterium tarhaniae]
MGGIGLDTLRRFGRGALVLAALSLGACGGVDSPVVATRTAPVEGPAGPSGDAATLGTGSVKVALILPLSGPGASVGAALRNAADLALQESQSPD